MMRSVLQSIFMGGNSQGVVPAKITGGSAVGEVLTAISAAGFTATGWQWYRKVGQGAATAISGATATDTQEPNQ